MDKNTIEFVKAALRSAGITDPAAIERITHDLETQLTPPVFDMEKVLAAAITAAGLENVLTEK